MYSCNLTDFFLVDTFADDTVCGLLAVVRPDPSFFLLRAPTSVY